MKKKLLINAITVEDGNIVPLLLKIKKWQEDEEEVTIFADDYLRSRIDSLDIISGYNFIELKHSSRIMGKLQFIFEALKRNLLALSYLRKIKKENFDVVYSISSVMDLIILPWLLKKIDKKIKWLVVFDNVVPLNDPGNKITRFLGWFFFRVSLVFLKKADRIFAISDELKQFLIEEGMDAEKIVMTGNAIEADLIENAQKDEKYALDALFIGRINETKGIYDMLNVLEKVKETLPDFRLGIMGEGDEETEKKFKNKIKEKQLEKNIEFLGYRVRQEKFDILKSSKCFWFLSFSAHESFGVALLEAVCSGLPAFCYDLEPFKKIYQKDEVIMSPKRDWQAVSQQVIKLFENNNFENKRGELLLNKYSWDNIAEKEASCF